MKLSRQNMSDQTAKFRIHKKFGRPHHSYSDTADVFRLYWGRPLSRHRGNGYTTKLQPITRRCPSLVACIPAVSTVLSDERAFTTRPTPGTYTKPGDVLCRHRR